ncbi:MAG: cation:proton antiporter [Burkholderiaceae bacterium]
MLSVLELTLILLVAAVVLVVALRRVGLPPLVAYLAVGVLLGPHATGLAANHDAVHGLGEIGVVFLMFSLGLEFSLPKLVSMRTHVFGLGGAQVSTTILAALAIIVLLPAAWQIPILGAELDWRAAVAIGGAAAMSSTALVSKLLTERRELETDHGQRVFAVLLFQDIAVIPLLITIPALAGRAGSLWINLSLALCKAALLLLLLLRFGPKWMGRWFNAVARQRSHELFTLNVLLATLLFAWLTHQAGLSMELGAFVAGMLIAETEFRYQVEEDIKPFRDVLLGLFFVAVGMQLDPRVVVELWPRVLVYLTLPLLIKFALIALLVRAFGGMTGTAIRTGIWLGQAGEFGFVLISQASGTGLLPDLAAQPILAAMLLSLLVSPLLIQQAGRIALRFSGAEWLQRSLQLQRIAARSLEQDRHVIICGFGRCGQALAHVLETEQVPHLALDLDPDRVRQAAGSGETVVYGDSTRRETLQAAGLHRARALVITFDDTPTAMRILHVLRQHAPALPVLVRTSHESDIERLRAAGATEVVPEIVEGSLMLASHVMLLADVPLARVQHRVAQVREGRYALLSGFFPGLDDRSREQIERAETHLRSIEIRPGSPLVGRPLTDLPLEGARVKVVVRHGRRFADPDGELLLEDGDLLVVSGTLEQLGGTEAKIASFR